MSKEIKVYKTAKPIENTRVSVYNEVKKYNPYHGADGRFASANGMGAGGSFALPKNSKNLKNATIPEGVRVFSGEGAKGKRAVTTSIGTTIKDGKIEGGGQVNSGTKETKKPQTLEEKYPLDTSKKVSSPEELFDRMTKNVDWSNPDSPSYKDAKHMITEGGGVYTSATHMVLDQLGYTDKPIKVSKEEFKEFVKKSPYGELQRGFSSSTTVERAKQYMKDFTDGNAMPNTSGYSAVYGQGFYFAYGQGRAGVADSYATMGRGKKGPILKAVLHPDAKVLKYDKNMADTAKYNKNIKASHAKEKGLRKELITKFEKHNTTQEKSSTYAALKGYDAVEVGRKGYLVILNRSAVIIQE